MYEESYFDPAAESVAGTQGLIQLLPATAEAMGVADPFEPESAIRGGVKYLRHLWDRFGDDIPPRERTWFALAAYNVGYHRGDRARQQAPASAGDGTRSYAMVRPRRKRHPRDVFRRPAGYWQLSLRANGSLCAGHPLPL